MSLKKCPSCGREHREKKVAERCMKKKLGKGTWKYEDFGLTDPSKKEEKEVKPKEKDDYDDKFNKLFSRLDEYFSTQETKRKRTRQDD